MRWWKTATIFSDFGQWTFGSFRDVATYYYSAFH